MIHIKSCQEIKNESQKIKVIVLLYLKEFE